MYINAVDNVKGKNCLINLYTNADHVLINLQKIIDIMHYLYTYVPAKNNGYGFLSGNIIVEDPGFKLFNYLRTYVQTQFPGDMYKENSVSMYYAYPRTSTHFNDYYVYTKKAYKYWFGIKKTEYEYIHYGIDIINGLQLPIKSKKHILFGKIGTIKGKQFIFIKFEEVGIHGIQVIQHMFNLLKKYLSEHKKHLPTDYRREDIPQDLMQEFTSLINAHDCPLSKKQKAEILDAIKGLGIRKMIFFANLYATFSQSSAAWREKMRFFSSQLKKRYPDWQYRFGNEIILMHDELI